LKGTQLASSQEAVERALVTRDDGTEAPRAPSLLRASLAARLALVAVVAAILWLAVYWALT
jgi:type VI protein secretion system component VasF